MSDQDFFFDEEDEKPAKAAKPAAKSPSKAGSGRSAEPAAPAGSFFEQSVTMSVASLLVVCGLLVGLIAGVLIGQTRANSLAGVPAVDQTQGGGGTAPQLTQEQINSGQLPPGHPSVGGASGGATGSAQPSQPATGK